ncbi:MAG TPA: acyl carrier protein [Pseudomonadales bacterium]|nr:acyl carrier protein [Pseudomonadales bacterium]
MNRDQISLIVQDIIRDVLDNNSLLISDNMSAQDVDNWDSLAHISIITAIEKQLNIRFNISEIESMDNIGTMIHLIEKKSQ